MVEKIKVVFVEVLLYIVLALECSHVSNYGSR